MAIQKVDERLISVSRAYDGGKFDCFEAVVRDGKIISMYRLYEGSISSLNLDEELIRRYILFCEEVLEAVRLSSEHQAIKEEHNGS